MKTPWPELPVETRAGNTPLFVLTGPTASGKTTLAHKLADRYGFRLLSLDSMMVYRGMDIGTAKPSREERASYHYAGLDYVGPSEDFSTGAYLEAIAGELDDRPAIAVGGTGLYLKAIMQGLDRSATVERDQRTELEQMSVQALQKLLDGERLSALPDPQNPRRLIRAIEQQRSGLPLPATWQDGGEATAIPVLQWPVELLRQRIRERVDFMLDEGLLEEVRGLGDWQGTSRQAIGYAEALEHLEGRCSREAMVERISIRTRQYAKRQRTWFRNQLKASWIDMVDDPCPELSVASCWLSSGPIWFKREHDGERNGNLHGT